MVLTKSDLMFCTLKLRVQDMEEKFADAINDLNESGRYEFSRDFLIKLSPVVLGKKAEYEVAKLNDVVFVELLRSQFDNIYKCLRQLQAWLEDTARIKLSDFFVAITH
jgi:hypothetical protein